MRGNPMAHFRVWETVRRVLLACAVSLAFAAAAQAAPVTYVLETPGVV